MKFYYCEHCGVRITELDIECGYAKNKKLKGIFCETCAVGVTTVDNVPLSNEDAQRIVDQESSRRITPVERKASNGSSKRIRPAMRGTGRTGSKTRLPAAPRRAFGRQSAETLSAGIDVEDEGSRLRQSLSVFAYGMAAGLAVSVIGWWLVAGLG